MALRGEGGRIRPLIAIVQTRYASPLNILNPVPATHSPICTPYLSAFLSISRLTLRLFYTLTCCFSFPNHFLSPIILSHLKRLITTFSSHPPTPPHHSHRFSDFFLDRHLTAIIDPFHYLVVLVRMRCLKSVNILTAPTIS